MKLFFSPGACSLSPHIVLRELGLPFDLERVDTKAGKTASGADYRALNPKGYVPALQIDGGDVLTEGAAIVQYLADRKPDAGLAPPPGTMERYRLQEWLVYIATEIHKGFSPLFRTKDEEAKKPLVAALIAKFPYIARQLSGRQFLLGDRFTVADAYLFTVLNWSRFVGIDLSQWPELRAFHERVGARPSVKDAIAAEKAAA
jgi:glutathione S-transferase